MFEVMGMGKLIKEQSYFILFLVVLCVGLFIASGAFAEANQYEVMNVVVVEGDTIWGIASQYYGEVGLSVHDYIYELRKLNSLDSALIYPGQTLEVLVAASSVTHNE
jgi:nucleoid-associated protein YgaU